jgi:hypothetical protein
MKQNKFDPVAFTMAYENGELNDDEIRAGFQKMVNSGLVWQLQGHYGRTAAAMIATGELRQ